MSSNATDNIYPDLNPLFEIKTVSSSRFGNASFFILCYSVCFCVACSYISKNPKAYSILSRIIEFIRSLTTGLIFSMFLLKQCIEIFDWNEFSSGETIFLSNLPIILMSTIYLLVTLCIFLIRRKKITENEYQRILKDVENSSGATLNGQELGRTDIFGKFLKNFAIPEVEDFNDNDAPFIQIPLLLFHSFFVGLGFSGYQYFGWIEMLIVVHKLCEIFRFKNALDKLKVSYRSSLQLMITFLFMTPSAILLRGFFSLYNVKFGETLASKLCDNIFAQSFLIIACVSTFIPFPLKWFDAGVNWLTTFFSYFALHYYFEDLASAIKLN